MPAEKTALCVPALIPFKRIKWACKGRTPQNFPVEKLVTVKQCKHENSHSGAERGRHKHSAKISSVYMSSHRNGTLLCLHWLVSILKKQLWRARTHIHSKWNLNERLVADLLTCAHGNTNVNFLWHVYMLSCHVMVALPPTQTSNVASEAKGWHTLIFTLIVYPDGSIRLLANLDPRLVQTVWAPVRKASLLTFAKKKYIHWRGERERGREWGCLQELCIQTHFFVSLCQFVCHTQWAKSLKSPDFNTFDTKDAF